VLYGHYAWAMASFVATAAVGTALALLFARAQSVPLGDLTVVSFASIQTWLPLLWVAGIVATAASVAVAMTADRRRVRYSGK
jgi:fructose-specific phosphotransferase system IIC component